MHLSSFQSLCGLSLVFKCSQTSRLLLGKEKTSQFIIRMFEPLADASCCLLCSITAVRKMVLRQTLAPSQDLTLTLTSPATPATPSPWTARPSRPFLWISWTQVLTTAAAPPVRRTLSALDSQTACVTEGSD